MGTRSKKQSNEKKKKRSSAALWMMGHRHRADPWPFEWGNLRMRRQ